MAEANLVVHIVDGFAAHADIVARMGKVKTGKSCLYVNRLREPSDSLPEDLNSASLAQLDARYPR